MPQTPTAQMNIDILGAKPSGDILSACPKLKEIKCFVDYCNDPEPGIPVRQVVTYVVLLYSNDSVLNRKPIEDLPNRRLRAAKMAEVDSENSVVIKKLFEFEGTEEGEEFKSRISDLVSSYLIYQKNYSWADRCATEYQMEENLKIRFKPIENEKSDKNTIEASTKKFTLTGHFREYRKGIKELDQEIFADHKDVRDIAVKKERSSIESSAK